ncbi:MAG TPA: hypothetical protein VK886_13415 [Vicinamibacterales bacterium]|nr:hypothetical protein [Vicinamibacterales bacterium]
MSLDRFRRARRGMSAGVAVVFTAAALLVCLPVPAAAGEGHCAPVLSSTQPKDHCDRPSTAMDCCEKGQQSPSVPAAPQNATRVDAGSIVLDAAHSELISLYPGPADAFALRGAPAHGYRHIDLPTLNSSFLI